MKNQGVFQLESGLWAYRFTYIIDGKVHSKRSCKDEYGDPIKNKRVAIRARNAALKRFKQNIPESREETQRDETRRTLKDVYDEYRQKGCSGKAYNTLLKQDSLWQNHIGVKFGNRFIDEVSAAEVNDYLSDLYNEYEFSYQYTESFLKMFYLIFGQAYSRNYLDVTVYNKLCVNKSTKIHMPKLRSDDETRNIISFSEEELILLDKYFEGTNAETAYLLGRYCGLRINECFGLKWSNVDLENGTIRIDRQMQYQNGLIKLVPVKTRNGRRTIYMSDKLWAHMKEAEAKQNEAQVLQPELREQHRRLLEDMDGKKVYSTELVNCLPDGTIQTVNSFKYPTREIKKKLGIVFKYHYLRHTYGTMMADRNTPQHLLLKQMGHGNIHVTQKYYLAESRSGVEVLRKNLNRL